MPSNGATECSVTTDVVPAGYVITQVSTSTSCPGFYGWTISLAATGVVECAELGTVPSGFIVTTVSSAASQCWEGSTHYYGWTLQRFGATPA